MYRGTKAAGKINPEYERIYREEQQAVDRMVKHIEFDGMIKSFEYNEVPKHKKRYAELIHPVPVKRRSIHSTYGPIQTVTQTPRPTNIIDITDTSQSQSYHTEEQLNGYQWDFAHNNFNFNFEPKLSVDEIEASEIAYRRDCDEEMLTDKLSLLKQEYIRVLEQYTDDPDEIRTKSEQFTELILGDIRASLDHEYYGGISDDEIIDLLKYSGYIGDIKFTDTQLEGIRFALRKFSIGKGCIIAHEMGLGKTLLTLALERILSLNNSRTSIIITPSGLAESWKNECFRFFGPSIRILFFEGHKKPWYSFGGKNGAKGLKHSESLSTFAIKRHDIVMTHYQALTKYWSTVVRQPIKDFIKSLTGDYFEGCTDKASVQKALLKEKFPDLDWSGYERPKMNSKSISIRVKSNEGSVPLVGPILGHHWGLIVVDESHAMRNPDSLLVEMCTSMNADYKLALTGTPTPNYTSDLWSMFKFIEVPDLEGYKEFSTNTQMLTKELVKESSKIAKYRNLDSFESAIEVSNATKRLKEKYNSPQYVLDNSEKNIKRILDMMDKWMQKITKNGLAQKHKTAEQLQEEHDRYISTGWKLLSYSTEFIPPAYEKVIRIEPYILLVKVHEAIRTSKRAEFYRLSDKREQNSFLTETVSHLRLLVSHPTAVRSDVYDQYCNPDDIYMLMSQSNQKMEKLIEYYVTSVKPFNQKMIVYAQFKKTAQFIKETLESIGVTSIYMDGDIDKKSKAVMCTTFSNSEYTKALCTTHCIGLGYNIPGANHVIFWDSWWNLPEDEQGYSRSLRPGQKFDVRVVRLLYTDTIEEAIFKIAQNKEKLNTGLTLKQKEILNF